MTGEVMTAEDLLDRVAEPMAFGFHSVTRPHPHYAEAMAELVERGLVEVHGDGWARLSSAGRKAYYGWDPRESRG